MTLRWNVDTLSFTASQLLRRPQNANLIRWSLSREIHQPTQLSCAEPLILFAEEIILPLAFDDVGSEIHVVRMQNPPLYLHPSAQRSDPRDNTRNEETK